MSQGSESVRLFVALELPGALRDELERWREPFVQTLSGLRRVAIEALHVTLCFLGGQPADAVGDVLATCTIVAGRAAARLTLDGPLWLPRRSPRVLAVALGDADGALAELHAELSGALAAGGWYRPESRPFLPHVTVARVRSGARVPAVEMPGPAALTDAADRVMLMRSRLGPAGPRYESLGTVSLR